MNFVTPGETKSNLWKWVTSSVIVVFLAGSAGVSFYFYHKYNSAKKVTTASEENQDTVAAVGKLIELPTNEQPTIATVTDPTKLGTQNFFVHAKVGDKVIIYANAKVAILYDPSENKLVTVAPIDLSDSNAPSVSGVTQTPAK